jgi:uncharacterized protein (TIGR02246 family)
MELTETNTKKEGEESMEYIAKRNFVLWNDVLQASDPKRVAKMYSSDATFLPTMSPDFKHGTSEAEEYFEHFLERNPKGVIVSDTVQSLGENSYLHSGMYNFEIDQDGGRTVIEARFSFVWRKEAAGEWKIIHHHSSVKPRE